MKVWQQSSSKQAALAADNNQQAGSKQQAESNAAQQYYVQNALFSNAGGLVGLKKNESGCRRRLATGVVSVQSEGCGETSGQAELVPRGVTVKVGKGAEEVKVRELRLENEPAWEEEEEDSLPSGVAATMAEKYLICSRVTVVVFSLLPGAPIHNSWAHVILTTTTNKL